MFVLVTSLCLAFSGGDVELDFVLMTSAYSQYLPAALSSTRVPFHLPI